MVQRKGMELFRSTIVYFCESKESVSTKAKAVLEKVL
jgi:hypothetical protein